MKHSIGKTIYLVTCQKKIWRQKHRHNTENTLDILQLFGLGNSGNPPTRMVRKNSSNFLRLLPVIVLPSDQTMANWKKPCSQKNIYKH